MMVGLSLSRVALPLILAAFITGLVLVGASGLWKVKDRDLIDRTLNGKDAVKAISDLTHAQRQSMQVREIARLASEPLDISAINNLSLLSGLANDKSLSEAFIFAGASRSLRDLQSQLTASRLHLLNKNYAIALFHLHAVLVSEPELGPKIFPSLASLLGDEQATRELSITLNRNPPWRATFIFWLVENDKGGQAAFSLFNQMHKNGGNADHLEFQAYLRKLISIGDYQKAYFVWLNSLNETELRKVASIYDGNFEFEPSNLFFDWNLVKVPNVDLAVEPVPGTEGERGLRVAFQDYRGPFGHVYQYLNLSPGKYQFTGELSVLNLKTPVGQSWKVNCIGGNAEIARGPVINSDTAWSSYSFSFNVPHSGCSTQVLVLSWDSLAKLDQVIQGRLMFKKFKISAVSQ
jgi:hypothetical protein